ncbi:hypothetical protein PIB30_055259 [Stylosanthes scabra]|uniref:Uncharacterized protein n=1 Tax=Stylosanthes scabra TaxID=79078 RepID=A0ABU6YIB2_9FABA|nr:hypothetical protein [Stylosanthes scabra]
MVYGMGMVPSHKYPLLFSDPDDDTASGPPDLREQGDYIAAGGACSEGSCCGGVCAEKVRTLESTVQTQSQEVSDLRRAYSNMYSFLTQMRSGASGSGTMPDMLLPPPPPPPPPPALSQTPAPSQTLPPQPDQTTVSPHHDDDIDYV